MFGQFINKISLTSDIGAEIRKELKKEILKVLIKMYIKELLEDDSGCSVDGQPTPNKIKIIRVVGNIGSHPLSIGG